MNSNIYGSYYGKFHRCSVSMIRNNIIVFDLGDSPYETWTISRMYPPETINIDSDKPFLLALKTFFKSEEAASVICNQRYLWTVCLGKNRMIYPISRDVQPKTTLHLYATPYFVTNPQLISQYLQGQVQPAYENMYFYKNTILYLDNQDLPYPGGCYFDKCAPTSFYRICFLSSESIDYVSNLAAEWHSRRDIMNVNYMTRDVMAVPKFIDFKPVPEFGFSESSVLSTGIVQRTQSSKKPEHIIQDILISFQKNQESVPDLNYLGLIIEWPLLLTYEGSRYSQGASENRKVVALSINGNHPNRVIYVMRPYERYVEYNYVPATVWTPISFAFPTLLTDVSVKKVVLDTVVVGLVYRDAFYCLSRPLLEGRPANYPLSNSDKILSVASFDGDPNVQVIETVRCSEKYSLNRVGLKGVSLETWCLTKSENTHPYPKNIQLPSLVRQWLDFFMQVEPNAFDVDVSMVRLALTLSKHKICYNLNVSEEQTSAPINLSDNEVKFYLNEKVVQFINDARLVKAKDSDDDGSSCTIS